VASRVEILERLMEQYPGAVLEELAAILAAEHPEVFLVNVLSRFERMDALRQLSGSEESDS